MNLTSFVDWGRIARSRKAAIGKKFLVLGCPSEGASAGACGVSTVSWFHHSVEKFDCYLPRLFYSMSACTIDRIVHIVPLVISLEDHTIVQAGGKVLRRSSGRVRAMIGRRTIAIRWNSREAVVSASVRWYLCDEQAA